MQILFVSVGAWFLAQVLKVLFIFIKKKKLTLYDFFSSGGMPSSHTALVSSLAIQIGLLYGFESPFFALASVNACIVMYDAVGVRRAVGLQAKKINQLLDDESKNEALREILGHTPLEVIGGLILGVGVGVFFSLFCF
ncbi:MAG: divergent PAP2 family protein [Clostridia bacterium]|nr:divergent PAP2 family protein [Clostridia bacterium]